VKTIDDLSVATVLYHLRSKSNTPVFKFPEKTIELESIPVKLSHIRYKSNTPIYEFSVKTTDYQYLVFFT
jgi:hypothetical protein